MVDAVVTSQPEPGSDPATSGQEPQPALSTPPPQPPQPSYEDLAARHERLESNYRGTFTEWQKERAERERLQALLEQRNQAQPAGAPDDEQLAQMETDAIFEGNKGKLAEVRRIQNQRLIEQQNRELAKMIQQASAQAAQAQATNQFIGSKGIDTGKIRQKAEQMQADPRYVFAHGNPAWLASLAVQELEAEAKIAKAIAAEKGRIESSDGAHTENPSGAGAIPGKQVIEDKIYLTADERKAIPSLRRYHPGLSEAEAEKRYWNQLPDHVRKERQLKKKA